MILNLWSEDQGGKIYGGGPREGSENIHQHCTYSALTACVLPLLLVYGDHFEWHIVVREDLLIDPRTTLRGVRDFESQATPALKYIPFDLELLLFCVLRLKPLQMKPFRS